MRLISGTKHISCMRTTNNKIFYVVQKRICGQTKHFGMCRTLIGVLMMRDWCQANDWQQPYPKKRSTEWKYIHKFNGKYKIQKVIDGKIEYFGSFNTLEDALKERDLLIKYNWNLYDLCDLN